MTDVLLRGRDITRRWGGLVAVDRVSIELERGSVGAVRGVDDVLCGLQRKVAADRAGSSLVRPGRTVDGPDHGDRIRPLEGQRDERRGRDEVDEAGEERLLAMRRVVRLGQ